jgi:hypothetical protein
MTRAEAVALLEAVAARGFASEPVQHWLSKDESAQYVEFAPEEKAAVRNFLGANPYLARVGRHRLPSFFGGSQTTLSLLERMAYAVSRSHVGPEYVSALSAELAEADGLVDELSELNKMMR